MNSEFTANFITNCLEKGNSSIEEICNAAKEEIFRIDETMKQMEELRNKQSALKQVIRQLKGNEPKVKPLPISDSQTSEENLDLYLREMCIKVCDYIELKSPTLLKMREIMDAISSLEENKIVLMAVKWLWDNEIIERDENSISREIGKGSNWSQRPHR